MREEEKWGREEEGRGNKLGKSVLQLFGAHEVEGGRLIVGCIITQPNVDLSFFRTGRCSTVAHDRIMERKSVGHLLLQFFFHLPETKCYVAGTRAGKGQLLLFGEGNEAPHKTPQAKFWEDIRCATRKSKKSCVFWGDE